MPVSYGVTGDDRHHDPNGLVVGGVTGAAVLGDGCPGLGAETVGLGRDVAEGQMLTYAEEARGAGRTWDEVAEALGIESTEDGQPRDEQAYLSCWSRADRCQARSRHGSIARQRGGPARPAGRGSPTTGRSSPIRTTSRAATPTPVPAGWQVWWLMARRAPRRIVTSRYK